MITLDRDIIPKLKDNDYFKKYKFRKSDSSLVLKTDLGFNGIEFYPKKTIDNLRLDELALGIETRWLGYINATIAQICNLCPQRKSKKTLLLRSGFVVL